MNMVSIASASNVATNSSRQQKGSAKTATPCAYPMPGTYEIAYCHIYIASTTPNAIIHYTIDGSDPTMDSPVFDPISNGALSVLGFGEGANIRKKNVVVKAIAVSEGAMPSDIAEFEYNFILDTKHGTYHYEILRVGTDEIPSLIRIVDYARVNIFLIVGSKRALVIDGGMDSTADLYTLVNDLTGGLPFDVVLGHGHGDHNAQTQKMLDANIKVLVSDLDLYLFGDKPPKGTINLKEGDTFNLGNTVLTTFFVPGHTPGSMVFFDEKMGDLFISDTLGSTDPLGPNSGILNLGGVECSLERYHEVLVSLRDKLKGKALRMFAGHDTFSVLLNPYLDNMIAAIGNVLENGESALVPSSRPAASAGGSSEMVGMGDYRIDHGSIAINVKYIYEEDAIKDKPVKGYVGR